MRFICLDYLRVMAAFMVVCIHVSASYYKGYGAIADESWWMANLINSFSRPAVPLFVMISGALLLGKEYSFMQFYKGRAARLLPALVFWSVFYLLFRYYYQGESLESIIWTLKGGAFLEGKTYYHLWYLSMFIGVMLFAPFVNDYVCGRKPTHTHVIWLMALIGIFMVLSQISNVAAKMYETKFEWFMVIPLYLGYFMLGYFIKEHHEKIKLGNKALLAIFVGCALSGAGLNYMMANRFDLVFDNIVIGNLTPLCFMMALSVFTLFIKNARLFQKHKLVTSLSACSFGIYLVHPAIIRICRESLPGYVDYGMFYIPVLCVLVFVVSYAVIALMTRTKAAPKEVYDTFRTRQSASPSR